MPAKPKTAPVTAHGSSESLDPETLIDFYGRMRRIREFEDRVQSLFLKGDVHGSTHLYSGQEANAVGVCAALEDRDRVAGSYRGHGHALAVGVDPTSLMAEILGRETGTCGGRAGSMNIADLRNGLIGCFAIIGGGIGAATGAALALRSTGAVATAFFGEGTANQAYFHECLNFAKVHNLPALYVCENNRYVEFTPFEDVTAGSIIDRPRAMGIPSEEVDGMDVVAVHEAATAAVARARAGEGPQFIEAHTYRFVGHSRSDPGRYRKAGELEEMKARDPLRLAADRLVDRFGIDRSRIDAIDQDVSAEYDDVVAAALSAPAPDPSRLATEFAPE
ncbi:MAG: hypothetical protein JWO02_3079 [Solirubrobacterales bacterium]|nr:hypothetical protein [Solirubrobacterales bacterium]